MKEETKVKIDYLKIIFVLLIIIGIGTRIYNFPEGIPEINVDEIITAINAKSIAETGKDIQGQSFPIYLKGWGGQSIILLYFMTLTIKIFGYNLFAIRLPMLIISCISLFVFYDFIKKITGNKIAALIGLGLVAISPWHIIQSLYALDCNMFPHFLLIAVDILYTGIIKNKKKLIYISIFFFAVTLYCYAIALYFTPLFLLIVGIYLIRKKKIKIKDLFLCILIFLICTWPIILTLIMNGMQIGQSISILNITIPYYEDLNRESDVILFSKNIPAQLLVNVITTLDTILFQRDQLVWNAPKLFGTIYHITIIFTILGIVLRFSKNKDEKSKITNTMLITWLCISVFDGLITNNTTIHRMNSIWYILLIFATLGIYEVYKEIKKKDIFLSILAIIYAILFVSFTTYFNVYYKYEISSDGCFSRGFYQTLNYLETSDKKVVYYDNAGMDIARKEEYYIEVNNDENIEYIPLNTKKEIEEKLENIKDNEIIIINANRWKENMRFAKKQIGSYAIIYK